MAGRYKEKVKPSKRTFAAVFGKCNYAQAECTFAEYQRLSGNIIQKGIKVTDFSEQSSTGALVY